MIIPSTLTLPTPRVPTPEALAIRWLKGVLKFYVGGGEPIHRSKFQRCALLKALNRLKGIPDAHVVKSNKHGYTDADACGLATRYIEQAGIRGNAPADPLRCYVIVNTCRRGDGMLSLPQRYAQAAHALAALTHAYKGHPDFERWISWDKTLVVLDETSGSPLSWLAKRGDDRFPAVDFFDITLGGRLAVAFFPLTATEAEAKGFKQYKLLGQ